eukprot:403374223
MMSDVINNRRYTLTEQRYNRNLYTDNRNFVFDNKEFDIAVLPAYTGANTSVTNIHQYFSIRFSYLIQQERPNATANQIPFIQTSQEINMTRCQLSRFYGVANTNVSNWFCANQSEVVLQGKSSNNINKRFRIEFIYCQNVYLQKLFPDLECKTREETDLIAKDSYMYMTYSQQFIDVEEFQSSPIKQTLVSTSYSLANFIRNDFYLISENYLVMKDNWLASIIDNENLTYSSVRLQFSSQQIKDQTKLLWLSLNFFVDENVIATTRTSYNTIDALTATGGFAQVIMVVFGILTFRIQKILYFLSMMGKLYLYIDDNQIQQNLNQDSYNRKRNQDKASKNNQLEFNPNFQKYRQDGNISYTMDSKRKSKNSTYPNQSNNNKNSYNFGQQQQTILNKEELSQRNLLANDNQLKYQANKKNIIQPLSTLSLGSSNEKDSQISMIRNQISRMRLFQFTLTEYLFYLSQRLCCKTSFGLKEKLYQIGVQKLSQEFDMIRYLKKSRVATSVAELSMSEYQRNLIPYFNQNVLTNKAQNKPLTTQSSLSTFSDINLNSQNHQQSLNTSIQQLVLKSRKSIIDRKIIQMLGFENINLGKLDTCDDSNNNSNKQIIINSQNSGPSKNQKYNQKQSQISNSKSKELNQKQDKKQDLVQNFEMITPFQESPLDKIVKNKIKSEKDDDFKFTAKINQPKTNVEIQKNRKNYTTDKQYSENNNKNSNINKSRFSEKQEQKNKIQSKREPKSQTNQQQFKDVVKKARQQNILNMQIQPQQLQSISSNDEQVDKQILDSQSQDSNSDRYSKESSIKQKKQYNRQQ